MGDDDDSFFFIGCPWDWEDDAEDDDYNADELI